MRANYNLSITLNSYTNVNNLCIDCVDQGIGCCDDFAGRRCTTPNRGSRCDTYFEYCLLPLNTVASNGPVSCIVRARSNPATDDSAINFAQSTVLGLSNPLVLREPSSAWNVSYVCIESLRLLTLLNFIVQDIRKISNVGYCCSFTHW